MISWFFKMLDFSNAFLQLPVFVWNSLLQQLLTNCSFKPFWRIRLSKNICILLLKSFRNEFMFWAFYQKMYLRPFASLLFCSRYQAINSVTHPSYAWEAGLSSSSQIKIQQSFMQFACCSWCLLLQRGHPLWKGKKT